MLSRSLATSWSAASKSPNAFESASSNASNSSSRIVRNSMGAQGYPLSGTPFSSRSPTPGACTTFRAGADEVPGLHLALALDGDRSPPPALELVLQQLVGRARDLDLARDAVGFHAARRVHCVAVKVVEEALGPDHARDDGSGVDADPK